MYVVPSLVALCVTVLAPYVDHAHALPVRLRLRSRRLIDHLVPDHALLDPLLWATIIQVFDSDGLPPAFASYILPLLHPNQPLLQAIPCSPSFSLITSLFLQGCIHITDATIPRLKTLHTLTALDVSNTSLTDYAIQAMAVTLHFNEDSSPRKHSGPWPLRILALRNCKRITNQVFGYLDKFPLLSVLDLRGTRCSPNATKAFDSCSNTDLYHPSSLSTALATLRDIQPDIYSSPNFYVLNVTTFRPTRQLSQSGIVTPQDAFVVIPSNNSRIKVGNTLILEKETREKEDALRHERNKEAWYQRQEILESRQFGLDESPARRENPISQQVESNLAAFIATPGLHRQHRDSSPSHRQSNIGVSPLPPQVKQVCTKKNRFPFKPQAPLPNPKGPTESGFTVTRLVQQQPQQKTVSNIRPLTQPTALHPNHLAIGCTSTGVSTQPLLAHNVQSGPRWQSYSLPRSSTSEGPVVLGTASTGDTGSLALDTIARNPGNQNYRTATAVDQPTNNAAQQLHIVSSNRFYDPLPSLPRRISRPSSLSSTPQSCPSDSTTPITNSRCKDNLMLYRNPPTWSALDTAVEQRRLEEETASQHRSWQRMNSRNEMAIVDMSSAKAARLKRQLGEYESKIQPHILQCTPANPSTLVEIQASQSRNPFRKHHSFPIQTEFNEELLPTLIAHKPPEVISTKAFSPISTIRTPALPPDVRKPALACENVGSTDANPTKKLKTENEHCIPEKTKEPQRKSSSSEYQISIPASTSRKEKPSAGMAFDWKKWGKK